MNEPENSPCSSATRTCKSANAIQELNVSKISIAWTAQVSTD
jgi:hypothetical protein